MREPEVLTVLILKFRVKRDIGGLCALSLADPFPGFSSDRPTAVILVLELLAACLPWANFASAWVLVPTANNVGLRLDGEYGAAYSGG